MEFSQFMQPYQLNVYELFLHGLTKFIANREPVKSAGKIVHGLNRSR